MRLIALCVSPLRVAIVRVLQCVASRGFVSSVQRTTRSTCASVIFRGAPGRGSSSKPSSRCLTKRAR
jgi:Tfp pilus assembly protein PilE